MTSNTFTNVTVMLNDNQDDLDATKNSILLYYIYNKILYYFNVNTLEKIQVALNTYMDECGNNFDSQVVSYSRTGREIVFLNKTSGAVCRADASNYVVHKVLDY